MSVVAGQPNEDEPPPILRIHRAYRGWCVELADALGCDPDWLATWFEEFTYLHMHEQGMEKNLAAFMAKRDCLAWFVDDGTEPS